MALKITVIFVMGGKLTVILAGTVKLVPRLLYDEADCVFGYIDPVLGLVPAEQMLGLVEEKEEPEQ